MLVRVLLWFTIALSVAQAKEPEALNFAGSEDPKGHWPGWRGWNTAGVSDEAELPSSLDTTTLLWKTPVHPGKSSPIIWGENIYLTAVQEEKGRPFLALHSFKKKDGEKRWGVPLQWMTGRMHFDNSFASATPVVEGDTVYVTSGFAEANLFAISTKDGSTRWKMSLGNLDHEYGTSVGPVLYKDSIIQLCDSEHRSALKAFDKKTGKLLWETARASTGSWGTPVIVKDGGEEVLVVPGGSRTREEDGVIRGYDPATGKELWQVGGTTAYVCPSPIIGRRHVFCGSGRLEGPLFALCCRRQAPERVTWQLPRGGGYVPTGVYYRDRLYMISSQGVFTVYDPDQRPAPTPLARYRLGSGRIVTASLIAGDGKIYSSSTGGEITVLSVGDDPKLVTKNKFEEAIHATPAISKGVIYVRTETQLMAFGKKLVAGEY